MRVALGSAATDPAAVFHQVGVMPRTLYLGTPQSIQNTGQSRPILFQLQDDHGAAGLWIVKAQCNSFFGCKMILAELVGADLCAWFGLNTPEVGLLRFDTSPRPTDTTAEGRAAARIYETDAGKLAFCSRYINVPHVVEDCLSLGKRRSPSIVADGVRLLLFDATSWHYDRTMKSPNAMLVRRRIVPFDHERAFYDIDAPAEDGCSRDYTANIGEEAVLRHIAAGLAAKNQDSPEWDRFVERLNDLTDSVVDTIAQRLPDELDAGKGGSWKRDLKRFIARRRECVLNTVGEVRRVLSKR